MRRERAVVGKKHISYLIEEPAGPVVRQRPLSTAVFLHAFPLHAEMWSTVLAAMPEAWRAVAPDFRGFGQSPLPAGHTHGMSDFAGDVIDLLDHLEVSSAAIVGCSMGGYVAFEILQSAPRYVNGLGLVSTRAAADSEEGRGNRDKMIAQVDRDGVGAIAAQMAPKLLGSTTQKDRPELLEDVRALAGGNSPEGLKAGIQAMRDRRDSTPLLANIKVPTLIVHGVEDVLIPIAEAQTMHRAIAHSAYEPIPSSGHLPNLERPDPFRTRLHQFLNQL